MIGAWDSELRGQGIAYRATREKYVVSLNEQISPYFHLREK